MPTKAIKDMKDHKELAEVAYAKLDDRHGGINLEISQTEALIKIAEELEKISSLLAVISKPYEDQPTKATTRKS